MQTQEDHDPQKLIIYYFNINCTIKNRIFIIILIFYSNHNKYENKIN
jgi:hypothetical protein